MLCALSGVEAEEPVVSPKSGGIFERKLIESFIATAGKDPLTDEPLAAEELVSILAPTPAIAPPKPPAFNLIPTMLAAFQNEWDAMALEMFSLRKQLQSTREALSSALHKYDAAVIVAARAVKERDEAQRALAELAASFGSNGNKVEAVDVVRQIPVDKLSAAREQLFALHKKLKFPNSMSAKSSVSLEETEIDYGFGGVEKVSFCAETAQLILSGPLLGTVLHPAGEKLEGFTATCFIHENGTALAAGFTLDKWTALASGDTYPISIPGLSAVEAHPSEPLFVAVTENTWALADKNGVLFTSAPLPKIQTFALHVDGLLLGLAHGEQVDVVDLASAETKATISLKPDLIVTKLQFAFNGYWLVVGSQAVSGVKSVVEIYDLRKNTLLHSMEFDAPTEFLLDQSCQILVTCQTSLQKLQVHLYLKKGKSWRNSVLEDECGLLAGLFEACTAAELQETGRFKFGGLREGKGVQYEIIVE